MQNNSFYHFGSKLLNSTFTAAPQFERKHDNSGNYYRNNLVKGKYQEISLPLNFIHSSGKKLCDLLDTGYSALYLISKDFKEVLEKNNFTGWKVFPIHLFTKKKERISDYYGFSIIGTCDSVSYKDSKIIKKRYIPTGPICEFYVGKKITGWDGSDFFCPRETNEIFISVRAAEVLEKNKLTNISLKRISEIETDIDFA